ncbi:YajQ family cyclic di-GMP-binding protein [Nodosilinea sp. P-1105]|uniref:YajQ family cyclic di-GMP-binding protein n=1 Tax=Nodosilinea sp. P-1105 TaxID=2546229 RepID=UPI00146BE5BB|nr:YajQ family cyclic di-GMP-binding protein [Nodosilinea sp. P-1105]NMF86234.1 YajQ family cyclic di-GMP-binding protein [Nodosilinea sp. P-1105]
MASSFSFDIVSDYDRQELVNALDQARRDVISRYDLKDTNTTIDLGDDTITIETASDMTLNAVKDLLHQKAAKRNLSLKIFDYGEPEAASGNRVRQKVTLKKGINQDTAKQISKLVRDNLKKVTASIQGDAVRVSGKSKDDLQQAMQLVKQEDWPMAIQFNNYR